MHDPPEDRPPLLPARELGFSLVDDGTTVPTVLIDTSQHPEIRDLARVHATEGIGDVRTIARRVTAPERDVLVLGVSLTRPVRAAFAVSFVLPDHRPFLEAVAAHGRLALGSPEPLASEQWLAIDIDGPSLRSALE